MNFFLALLKFQSESNRKPNPDTCEEDIEELKLLINLSPDQTNIDNSLFDEYYGYVYK